MIQRCINSVGSLLYTHILLNWVWSQRPSSFSLPFQRFWSKPLLRFFTFRTFNWFKSLFWWLRHMIRRQCIFSRISQHATSTIIIFVFMIYRYDSFCWEWLPNFLRRVETVRLFFRPWSKPKRCYVYMIHRSDLTTNAPRFISRSRCFHLY